MKINKKGYKPLDKPAPKSFCQKCIYLLRMLIYLLIILFIVYIIKRFLKKRQSLNNNKFNKEELFYQKNPGAIVDSKELKEINNFINNDKLINPDEIFKKYEQPKISIIMPIYNGEKNLEKSLLSIYNQDFK